MALCYLMLVLLFLWKIKFRTSQNRIRESLSIEQARSIQGIFVVLVMLSHFSTYVELDMANILDKLFVAINNRIGQLMVVMFLFYSGYGIMEKIKKNTTTYLENFGSHRFFPVYMRFFVSLLLFLLLNICTKEIQKYSLMDIVLSFVAWRNIGNSNWFMFATFFLYTIIIISFKTLRPDSIKKGLLIFTLFTIIYIIVFSKCLAKGVWWYNTILCFPFGMWFNFYIDKIEALMEKKYAFLIGGCGVLLGILYLVQDRIQYTYCFMAILFSFFIVLITSKIKIGNKILDFFGKHIFSIYMLQRLTYILFASIKINRYLFLIIAFATTILIAVCFDYCFDVLYKKIRRVLK